jgi:hypothetical protein
VWTPRVCPTFQILNQLTDFLSLRPLEPQTNSMRQNRFCEVKSFSASQFPSFNGPSFPGSLQWSQDHATGLFYEMCSVYILQSRFFKMNVHFVFKWWRAPQQMLRTHRSLKAFCATLWWRWAVFFTKFLQVMEHQWNKIDRGKPTTRRKTCPSATLSTTNPTWTDPW